MNCPYCQQEMRKGYQRNLDQPIQWIPEGQKPSLWRGGVAKDGVSFGVGGMWTGYQAEAHDCPSCHIVINPVK